MASTSDKGKTIFEMAKDWWNKGDDKDDTPQVAPTPRQPAADNPFDLKHGDFAQFKTTSHAGKRFMVVEISHYRRTVGGKMFTSTDFFLHDEDSDTYVTLRANPRANITPDDPRRTDFLVLEPDYEGEYDETLHKQVLPGGVIDVRNDAGEVVATYQRLYGKNVPDALSVQVLAADGTNVTEKYEGWDFGRNLPNGKPEFYFVEMSTDTGRFQMLRGTLVNERDIVAVRASN